ncbi:MAG: RluA family pseudouridine synthase [Patescibacteria group bacterium]
MALKILYEDDTLLVIDKPADIPVWKEGARQDDTIATLLLGQFPELEMLGEQRRYGIVHRLDKDTSGILLVAKTKNLFDFLQEQFQKRNIEKRYICLVEGRVKKDSGVIHTLLGRSPADRRKQKAYSLTEQKQGRREAKTEYRVLQRLTDPSRRFYTLVEVQPKTGRKHQIRAHMVYLDSPIAGDKLYGFKNQSIPEGLARQFLHASFLKIPLPNGSTKEFHSPLPEDLKRVLIQMKNDEI